MSTLYLICNETNHFLAKSGEWTDTLRVNVVYRTVHKDEALNQLLEINAKDIGLRLRIVEASYTEDGIQLLAPQPPAESAPTEEILCD